MTAPDHYPDEPAGPFRAPPLSFTDEDGREIRIRTPDDPEGVQEALVEMYDAFDSADRAQGLPPIGAAAIREWIDTVLADDCLNVLACHGGDVAGHAMLVPDDDAFELAIFVHQAYQEAGIGTRLLESLLGHGASNGVERVWLTVERWNRPAIGLYRKVGFETTTGRSFELEMSIRLADPDHTDSTG